MGLSFLAGHRERQKKLLPLFSPELRAMRVAFVKGLWQLLVIFTVVFWISISFLLGAGYDTTSRMKDATYYLHDFDGTQTSALIREAIMKASEDPAVFKIVDTTDRQQFSTLAAVRQAVWDGDAWGAIVLNAGFERNLTSALYNATDYDPTLAATLITEESRHYFKVATVSQVATTVLGTVGSKFAPIAFEKIAQADGANATEAIDRANPLALVQPFGYATDNIAPYHFDLSLYILSVTLSLGMVIGAFIPSNMWKTIEEPFFKQVKIVQLIGLRATINVVWAFIICLQETGILFAFRGPTWSPTVGDFFGIFGLILLNTLAFSFFIDCLQNWVHPRFLLAIYFVTLFVNISASIFGPELNSHFFRIVYATPFLNTGISLRTLMTRGSYNKFKYSITIPALWTVFWWLISTFLIARKARLVRAGKLLMANIPPPPKDPEPSASEKPLHDDATPPKSSDVTTYDEGDLASDSRALSRSSAEESLASRHSADDTAPVRRQRSCSPNAESDTSDVEIVDM